MTNKNMKKIMILNISLVIFGIIYFILLKNNFGIKCIIKGLFNIKCPACGISRMVLALSKFNFKEAFSYNQFIFCTGIFLFIGYIVSNILYYKTGKIENKFNIYFYSIYTLLLIIWMIIRNLL